MKTKIKTAHEEQYSDNSRVLGVLLNYEIGGDWKESFIYIYRDETYVLFNTIIDMIDYLLYADKNIKRAYMDEKKFDEYYDVEFIDGKFSKYLIWVN